MVSLLELERQDNILDQEPQVRVRASYAIRIRTSDNNPFKIDDKSLNEIVSQELPNPALMAQTYAEQVNLGLRYADGAGVPQDDAEAVRWYQQTAEQGDAKAQCNLGVMCAFGRGVPPDDAKAVRWYQQAAEQGDAKAQCNLGIMHSVGAGVLLDDVTAYMWFNLASRSTGEDRELSVRRRDIVAARMTPEGRSEAQRLAREWDAAHPREP